MKIKVATSWSDVTVRQFIELSKVKELGFDELDTSLRVISILSGVDDVDLVNISLSDLKRLSAKTDFIKTNRYEKLEDFSLKLKGQRYRIEWDATKLVAGEYIDIQNYISKGAHENIHKIMASYIKPVNLFGFRKKGCYKKSKEGKWLQTVESRAITSELILDHLTMDKVFSINGFFLNRWKRLTEATQVYLEQKKRIQMKKLKRELKKMGLQKSTAGI